MFRGGARHCQPPRGHAVAEEESTVPPAKMRWHHHAANARRGSVTPQPAPGGPASPKLTPQTGRGAGIAGIKGPAAPAAPSPAATLVVVPAPAPVGAGRAAGPRAGGTGQPHPAPQHPPSNVWGVDAAPWAWEQQIRLFRLLPLNLGAPGHLAALWGSAPALLCVPQHRGSQEPVPARSGSQCAMGGLGGQVPPKPQSCLSFPTSRSIEKASCVSWLCFTG